MKLDKIYLFLFLTIFLSSFVNATTETAIQETGLNIGIGIFVLISLYIAFNLESKHFILKYFLIIVSVICLYLISSVFATLNGTGIAFYKLGLWLMRIFFFYVLIYFVYELLKWKNIIGGNGGT